MSGSVDLGGRRIIKKIFFKQKTAYEIVTGDWSSDVCSSDLQEVDAIFIGGLRDSGLYDEVWQAGAMLLPVQSVEIGRASCRERV